MKRTKVTYTDNKGDVTFIKPQIKPKRECPYFKVNHNDKTEVLRDGKLFAKTNSHIDAIRIVMAMKNIYKQKEKSAIHHNTPKQTAIYFPELNISAGIAKDTPNAQNT